MWNLKNNLQYILLLIWIYLGFIIQTFSLIIPVSICSYLKYIILIICGIILFFKNKFKINKKIIFFLIVYFSLLLLNIILVSYDIYVLIDSLTSLLTMIIPFYIISIDNFDLKLFSKIWYSFSRKLLPLLILIFILYKFDLYKYSVFDTILLPSIFIMSFYYNINNSKKVWDIFLIIFMVVIQTLFGGRMSALTSILIVIYSFIFLRNISNKRKVLYIFILLVSSILLYFSLPYILNILINIFEKFDVRVRTLSLLKNMLETGTLYMSNRDSFYPLIINFLKNNYGLPGGFGVVRYLTNGSIYHAHNLILNLLCFFGFYGTLIIIYICFKKMLFLKKEDNFDYKFCLFIMILYLFRSLTGTYFLSSIYSILFVSILFFKERKVNGMKNNIIITGGGTSNKGAQSMLLITVDECKKKYPNCKIYVLSKNDYRNNDNVSGCYKFDFIDNNFFMKLYVRGGLFRFIARVYMIKNKKLLKLSKEYENICKSCRFHIDISGFALSSKFPWKTWIMYFLNLSISKKYNIPVYIMPQSFGPFNFSKIVKPFILKYMYIMLNSTKVVFCREVDGYNLLNDKLNTDLRLSYDLVLLNKKININNIYKKKYIIKKYFIKNRSVGIIPNTKLLTICNEDKLLDLYKKIINELNDNNYNVYIIKHSAEDYNFCIKIKNMFKKNNNINIISDDINCIDFDELIKKFDFLVASRYHSIIHSYKNFVPCIALGWAIKYVRLLENFDQSKYMINLENNDFGDVCYSINLMIKNNAKEKDVIRDKIIEIQKNNIFDIIE